MARTPTVTRDKVEAQHREAFDRVTADNGDRVDSGPGSVMINSPDMRERANNLVKYFREVSDLPQPIQELIMILTARHMDCQYIWFAHSARARQHGLSDELVDAIRDKKPLPELPADQDAVAKYVVELFTNHKVNQSTFDTVIGIFGAQRLTEITTMMGYYSLLAFNVNAFEVDVPTGGSEQLLPL